MKKEDKKEKDMRKKELWKKKFRVVGIAVYFSILFPKYSQSFTARRFKLFREVFVKNKGLKEKEKEITRILKEKFESFIFSSSMKKNDLGQSKEVFVMNIQNVL